MKLKPIVASMSAVLLAMATSSHAEDNSTILDTVTVKGEKLDRDLQDTTSSVTVYDSAKIEDNPRMADLFQLLDQTTNVASYNTYNYVIRGIRDDGTNGAALSKTIGIFVDGVAQGQRATQRGYLSMWDLEQAEVLKGPQSTNQGRNSLAGSIVLKSNDPEFESNGKARLGFGTANTHQLAFMQTGPISDNTALRIAIDRRHTDGFVENTTLDIDDHDKETATNIRGKLLHKLQNGGQVLLSLSGGKYDDRGMDNVRDEFGKDRKSIDDYQSKWITNSQSHSLNVNYPINNNWELVSVTAFADEKFDRNSDINGEATSSKTEGGLLQVDDRQQEKSQEFRFEFSGEKTNANIGLYLGTGYYKSRAQTNNFSLPLGGPLVAIIDFDLRQEESYTNTALFANIDYEISPKLTLLAGLRADRDARTNEVNNTATRKNDLDAVAGAGTNAFVDGILAGQAGAPTDVDSVTTNLIPKLGFNYAINNDVNAGFVYTQGYRPGGATANPIKQRALKYDAEFTQNYEASFRSKWLDNQLTLNANIFYTEYKDQQVNIQGDGGQFDVDTVNAGKSNLKGFEVDTNYRATKNLDLFAGVGRVLTNFDEFNNGTADLSGKQFQGSPNLTANAGATYRDNSGYFVTGNLTHLGESYQDAENEIKLAGFSTVNLKAGYEADDYGIYFYANNLFNNEVKREKYFNGDGTPSETVYNDPRTLGLYAELYW